jgi:hypothetical protein
LPGGDRLLGRGGEQERHVRVEARDELARHVGGETAADEADEAVAGRRDTAGSGEMLMTAVVTSVLFRPISAPDAITAMMTTQRWPGKTPMTPRMTATRIRLQISVRVVPYRFFSAAGRGSSAP